MIQHAQIIAAEVGVIEVLEEMAGGLQFSYYRKDGKLLGSRFEAYPPVQQPLNTVSNSDFVLRG